MTIEWGTKTVEPPDAAALNQMNLRRMVRKLSSRMVDVIDDIPRRSDRHTGYRLRRRIERDALFGLVNRVTDLNIHTHSVRRVKPHMLVVTMTSGMGPIIFKAWSRRG